MKIQIRLTKKWGEYKVGDEVMFDERKGRPLIANGTGVEVRINKAQAKAEAKAKAEAEAEAKVEAEAKAKAKAEAETASIDPAAETAENSPTLGSKTAKGQTAQDNKKGGKK